MMTIMDAGKCCFMLYCNLQGHELSAQVRDRHFHSQMRDSFGDNIWKIVQMCAVLHHRKISPIVL